MTSLLCENTFILNFSGFACCGNDYFMEDKFEGISRLCLLTA
jgi:hypothetical protein